MKKVNKKKEFSVTTAFEAKVLTASAKSTLTETLLCRIGELASKGYHSLGQKLNSRVSSDEAYKANNILIAKGFSVELNGFGPHSKPNSKSIYVSW